MKLTVKPNQNSGRPDSTGTRTFDMVDLLDADGAVYGSVHVDLFWGERDSPWRSEVFEPLRQGAEMTFELVPEKEAKR